MGLRTTLRWPPPADTAAIAKRSGSSGGIAFNPRNINYGAWIEQRRQVFLEQAGANRYFWFAFWEFAGICFLLLWAAKERMDRKDTEWEAAECLADLANYADYCRRHASRRFSSTTITSKCATG